MFAYWNYDICHTTSSHGAQMSRKITLHSHMLHSNKITSSYTRSFKNKYGVINKEEIMKQTWYDPKKVVYSFSELFF